MSKTAVFMIEGGKALEMVKHHISERLRVQQENRVLAKDLGVTEVCTDNMTGQLRGVVFDGEIHPEFTKPKGRHGISYPKKKTAWHERFAAQRGHHYAAQWIAEELGVPLWIRYRNERGNGGSSIGNPLNECGFLYLGVDGPYAMWVPDVPAYVAEHLVEGDAVDEPAASFKLEFEGCRRIEREEWEIIVAQHKLAEKKAAALAESEGGL